MNNIMETSFEEGKVEGKIEGKVEGKVEGKNEAKLEMARALKQQQISIEIIIETTGLSEAEINAL